MSDFLRFFDKVVEQLGKLKKAEQVFVRSESCRRGKKQLFMRMMIGEQLLKKRGMRDLMLV